MARVLIADDASFMRQMIREIIEPEGHEVVGEATNGIEAVDLFKELAPDLVTMDIVMPGKDGVAAATELLAAHPTAVVVMCTSMTTRDKVVACQKVGVAHYLLKPFQPERAIAVFRHVLNRAGAA